MGCIIHFSKIKYGSAQLTGEAPGLQIRCEALKPSRVGSIPMHFRHLTISIYSIVNNTRSPHALFCTSKTPISQN